MVNSKELCLSHKEAAGDKGFFKGFILQMGNSQQDRCCLQNFHRLDKICKNHLEHAGKLKIKLIYFQILCGIHFYSDYCVKNKSTFLYLLDAQNQKIGNKLTRSFWAAFSRKNPGNFANNLFQKKVIYNFYTAMGHRQCLPNYD